MSLSSSLSSASGAESSPVHEEECASPTPQTVSASLDEYVCASKVGRAAFASGDLKTAVEQFDQALKIELQTEMDCLYDTSLGFVSGLVRQEVESRLVGSPKHESGPPSCEAVLGKLAESYTEAERQLTIHPTVAKWYLQMGACLCLANAWEQARKLYNEGLNLCKDPNDRKQLVRAVKNLTRVEQVTQGDHLPQPYESGLYAPWKPKIVLAVPKKPKRHFSLSLSPRRQKFHGNRPKSAIVAEDAPDFEEEDLPPALQIQPSLDHQVTEPKSPERERALSDPPTPPHAIIVAGKSKSKRKFGLSLKKRRQRSFELQRPQLSIDYEERQSWLENFGRESDIASGCQGFCPSAIVHMRRLSLESLSPALSRPVTIKSNSVPSYKAVKPFESIQIEGDDSEMED